MHINRRSTFFLGIFIFLVPFLGVPSSWKTFFIVVSGIVLVLLSLKINIPKKYIARQKMKKDKPFLASNETPIIPTENPSTVIEEKPEIITESQPVTPIMDIKPRTPRRSKKAISTDRSEIV